METLKFLLKYIVWGFVLAISATITGVLIVKAWNGLLADSWDTLTASKWNELVGKLDGLTNSWGNIGIGTATPGWKLAVAEDVSAVTMFRPGVVMEVHNEGTDVYQ